MISIKDLNKYYNKGKNNEVYALKNVSLELPEQGLVALCGKSGCGKTTLLNMIGGQDGYASGTINIADDTISKKTDMVKNKYIGYIFQNYCLDEEQTVFENVASSLKLVGIKDEIELKERVIDALSKVDMEKYYKRKPDTLSGGQQQRVAIARAIVKNPKVILADEPTGNLDEENTYNVMKILCEYAKNHLVIMVTHETDNIENFCDEVIYLSDGKIIDRVRKDEGVRTELSLDMFRKSNDNAIDISKLNKMVSKTEFGEVTYYGEAIRDKINIKIINYNNKIYLELDNENVCVIDKQSDIKFEEKITKHNEISLSVENKSKLLDDTDTGISKINESISQKEIQYGEFGKLYHFRDSIKSGFVKMKSTKRSDKIFRFCMFVAAIIIAYMSAVMGINIKKIWDAKSMNNPNVFYAYVEEKDTADLLLNSMKNGENGIDQVLFTQEFQGGDEYFYLLNENFENSFSKTDDDEEIFIEFNAVLMNEAMDKECDVVCGRKSNLADDEIVITTASADKIIENSLFSYIDSYDSLIGFNVTKWFSSEKFKIVGIVDSKETSVYMSESKIAEYRYEGVHGVEIISDKYSDVKVEKGKVMFLGNVPSEINEGDSILLYGDKYEIDKKYNSSDAKKKGMFKGLNYENDAYPVMYMMNYEDYIKTSHSFGESVGPEIMPREIVMEYARIHSNNPALTEKFILDNFSNVQPTDDSIEAYVTPDILYEREMRVAKDNIAYQVRLIGVMLILLGFCTYMMMRANTMKRIKEIAIYRSIGVTRKNIRFKIMCESLVIISFSAGLGLVISSIVMQSLKFGKYGKLMNRVIYYPLWMAALVLILTIIVLVIISLIPLHSILKKKPAEIMSKYDI